MPRRPPRKPPADLDLSQHFFQLGDLAAPLDPASLFAESLPVELEVGSGKGMFLAAAGCPNGRVIHGDAMQLVSSLLPDQCLSGVHVYFPDPWWKARHRKRRILNPVFLAHAARLLPPDGRLHIWTDVEEYFQEAVAATAATGRFGPPAEELPGGPDSDYRTHFERRTRLAGDPVWRAVFRRNELPAAVARLDPPAASPDLPAAE